MIQNAIWHMKFLAKKPGIAPRIVKDYFYVRVLGKKRLRTIDFAITYRCNSACVMCSAKTLMESNKGNTELSTEEIINVWRQATELGAIHMNLTGGEPTVRKTSEVVGIIKGINSHKALSSMVTNSIKMDFEMLKSFRDAGLDTIQLSLESMDAQVHDHVRGTNGNWDKLMKVFSWAKELKLNICLSAVITSENFDEVNRIISFGKEKNVFVLLNPISSSGKMSGDDSLSIKNFRDRYYDLLKMGHVRSDTILNFRGGAGCPAGVERIYITPYGDVLTCPHVQVSYGNVRKEPLKKIYDRISNFPYLCEFQKHCRHVWNEEYIEKVMAPTFHRNNLPININDHPVSDEPEVKSFLKKHQ